MTRIGRLWIVSAAAASVLTAGVAATAQNVEAGVRAWQAERYDEAVGHWRPLADRGDADAQFNLGHAYRLGRGVPRNMNLAEQWYERAARSGHVEAQAMYGLILFQNGRRREAMPFVARAAEAGDARAQYVYGTALFNGDLVEQDKARAFAFLSRAARTQPYAQAQLREMEQHLTEDERVRGADLAARMDEQAPARAPDNRLAAAEPPAPRDAGAAPAGPRSSTVDDDPPARPRPARPSRLAETRPAPTTPVQASANGRWRVQLGAFSSDANARRAWGAVAARLSGLQPFYVRSGNVIRLQAGPFGDRAAAVRACAALRGQACFPVGP